MKAVAIKVFGAVQGVGFRPFIWRIAKRENLVGFVRNENWGVYIIVEGNDENIGGFLKSLKEEVPPAAKIEKILVDEIAPQNFDGFTIEHSHIAKDPGLVPPDMAVCKNCLSEMNDPADRRYFYPFINCTDCGPRFTIVKELPYDRAKTTMSEFAICGKCKEEYENPADRRYHAQPVACPACGPEYKLRIDGVDLGGENAIKVAARMLCDGKILAVHGIGGFHIMCDAGNDDAILRLREWKNRPTKPFALMARNIEVAKKIAEISRAEMEHLTSPWAPILLLRTKEPNPLWAPGLDRVGIMLPYAPVHHLLFDFGAPEILIATSGNKQDEPITKSPESAFSTLDIAEAILWHNRPIHNRADDSVGVVFNGELMLTRRARGYVPARYELPCQSTPAVAFGSDLKGAIAVSDGRFVYPSQFLCDQEHPMAQEFLMETIEKFLRWTGISQKIVLCDLHPDYHTTRLAQKFANKENLPLVQVQHHHAHALATMLENNVYEKVLALSLDGVGYGADGTIWGGEILLIGPKERGFKRVGHLQAFPQPGGDIASTKIARMCASVLIGEIGEDVLKMPIPLWKYLSANEIAFILNAVKTNRKPITSSLGRIFDSASAGLGIAFENSYEGEAPMKLEAVARKAKSGNILNFDVRECEGKQIIRFAPTIAHLVKLFLEGNDISELAMSFHITVAEAFSKAVKTLATKYSIETIIISGGVAQNTLLLSLFLEKLNGLKLVLPKLNPPNDQGIAVGQIASLLSVSNCKL